MVSSLSSVSSVSFIDSLPADRHALHDIRFRLKVDNIWTVIATNYPELRPNEVSKDISLEPIVTHDLTIKTTIHHTDTVSVMVACSLNPIAVDLKGLVRLSNALTRVEERLLRYVDSAPLSYALLRIYTKDLKTQGTRIRRERQEYPNKRFDEAMDEKLTNTIEMRVVD